MTQVTTANTSPAPAAVADAPLLQLKVKILRFNPETDKKSQWVTYDIQAAGADRVVDVLNEIKWYQEPSLTFRRSCQHGICGSDAMLINGRNRLACKTLVRDVAKGNGSTITVEPIRGLKVEKDLLVDMEPFFDAYRAIMPYFIHETAFPAKEMYQSEAEADRMKESSNCILCACCTTSCPIFWVNGNYLGPAAIVQAHRFIFDTRDQAKEQRLGIMNQNTGVWRCRTAYNCTEACPRNIPITQLIEEVKREVMFTQS